MTLSILLATYNGEKYLDERLMLYRQHGNNSVAGKDVNSVEYAVEKLKKSSKSKSVNVRGQLQVDEVLKFFS